MDKRPWLLQRSRLLLSLLVSPRTTKAARTNSGVKRPIGNLSKATNGGDVGTSDQLGLIATHLLLVTQHLEALVKIGKVLAASAKDTKRDKVLGALARTKADGAAVGSDDDKEEKASGSSDSDDEKGPGKKKRGGKGKGLKAQIDENTKAKAKKTKE